VPAIEETAFSATREKAFVFPNTGVCVKLLSLSLLTFGFFRELFGEQHLSPAIRNDKYTLTTGSGTSAKTSKGTFTGGVLTLEPLNSSTTFTAIVSRTSLTALNGTVITWTDNTTDTAPGAMTNSGSGGGDDYEFSITGYLPPQTMNDLQSNL
jgi:hypothetical protein